jgi:hypothetical protein
MVFATIDSDRVAKACPREFLRFRLELAGAKLSMPEFASFLDTDLWPVDVDTTEVIKAYKKLCTKFKRAKKIEIQLTAEMAFDGSRPSYYSMRKAGYYDVRGHALPAAKFAGCIWITEVKLPKYHRDLGVKIIERIP